MALYAQPAQLQPSAAAFTLNSRLPPAHPAAIQARQIMQQMHNAVAAAEWGGQDGDPELSIGNSVEDPMSSMDEEGEVRGGGERGWGELQSGTGVALAAWRGL